MNKKIKKIPVLVSIIIIILGIILGVGVSNNIVLIVIYMLMEKIFQT